MASNPYEILGVSPQASDSDIRTAYRRLAKELHPDLNPGDKNAEEQFKRVSAAYAIVGNEDKRGKYDRGEIDESGLDKPARDFYRNHADDDTGFRYHSSSGYQDFADLSDLFRGAARQREGFAFSMRGADLRYRLEIEFLEAIIGARKLVTLSEGKTLEIEIPAGVSDGQVLRLKGKGEPAIGAAEAGDALVEINIRPHPYFTREGDDIKLQVPIGIDEAILGAELEIPTISGKVLLKIPKGINNRKILRLKGKGAKNSLTGAVGDQLVEVQITLPPVIDADLEAAMREWRAKHPYRPARNF